MTETELRLTPLEYMVYGVLCAARKETGPEGARRVYRIQERIEIWDDSAVEQAVTRLIRLGWVRKAEEIFPGMIHYEVND